MGWAEFIYQDADLHLTKTSKSPTDLESSIQVSNMTTR